MVQGANIYKKMELTLRSERKKQIYLHFSEPQGRKAHAVGLKRITENGKRKTAIKIKNYEVKIINF